MIKIGDKVKIRKDLKDDELYGKEIFVGIYMGKLKGKTVTISRIESPFYRIKEDDDYWNWTKEMFELPINSVKRRF